MFPKVENIKLSGYQTSNPSTDLIYHKNTNSYYKITSIKKTKKGIILFVRNLDKTVPKVNKLMFEETNILYSTRHKDCFGNEIFENSLIRDIANDEYGVVKFGVYPDFDDKDLLHDGFYIKWDNKKDKRVDFNFWIDEGIQLVDLQDRRTLKN